MKHPIIDCTIQIEEGIEAHLEQIEDDLMNLQVKLAIAMLSGIEKSHYRELAECAVDIEILEEYLQNKFQAIVPPTL
jgi:hypothetical protein